MTDYTLMTYITNNYMTLLLLASLTVLLIANRKMKVDGLQYIWLIMGIVFTLTLCEAVEDMCDLYMWDYRLLYIKTALSYWLYPLMAMLELYLIAPIKRKLLVAVPYIINFILVFLDIFDAHIIFLFDFRCTYYIFIRAESFISRRISANDPSVDPRILYNHSWDIFHYFYQ